LKHVFLVLSLNVSVLVSHCVIVLTFRDSKSYAKYIAVNSEMDQRICQDLIYGDNVSSKGKKVMFDELIAEQRSTVADDEVYYFLFFDYNTLLFQCFFFYVFIVSVFRLLCVHCNVLFCYVQAKEFGKLHTGANVKVDVRQTSSKEIKAGLTNVEDLDGLGSSKCVVHLNVSNLNGCFFNFGHGSGGSSAFPFGKE
jgi:hypothetical protein